MIARGTIGEGTSCTNPLVKRESHGRELARDRATQFEPWVDQGPRYREVFCAMPCAWMRCGRLRLPLLPVLQDQAPYHERLDALSTCERQVLGGLVAGQATNVIAFDLGISPRTVEIYRVNVMTQMQSRSLSDLVRMALVAGVLSDLAKLER